MAADAQVRGTLCQANGPRMRVLHARAVCQQAASRYKKIE